MSTIGFTANIGKYHGLKFGQDGKPRISFSAAETARIKDQSGQWVDGGTTWFNVTLFGYTAEDLEAVQALGYASAPVVIVNDDGDTTNEKHWYGFRPDLLEEFTTTKEAA